MTIPAGVIVTHSSTNGQTRLSLIEEFLAHLPKTLWEIGTKHVILTEVRASPLSSLYYLLTYPVSSKISLTSVTATNIGDWITGL